MARSKASVKYYRVPTAGFEADGEPIVRITLANGWADVRLHCMGEDDREIAQLPVPAVPETLRELAKALSGVANAIEAWRKGRSNPN